MKISIAIKFTRRVLNHKWHVLRYGLVTKAPLWRLLAHDLSKFSPTEFPVYARHIAGGERCDVSLSRAWNHHHKSNPHHWEYWVPVSVHGLSGQTEPSPLQIPDWAIREMVADWLAVTWHKQGSLPDRLDDFTWYQNTKENMQIHPTSRMELETLLDSTLRKLKKG